MSETAKIEQLEIQVQNLAELIRLQQKALETLGDALRGHQAILEALQPVRAAMMGATIAPLTVN